MALVYREGNQGRVVRDIQTVLRLTVDGCYGPKTTDAVKRWQASHQLTVDGVAGPATLSSLGVAPVLGMDVSHHNGVVDFKAAWARGVRWVYIKASEGQTFRDPSAKANAIAARAAGMKVGVYHFCSASSSPEDAKLEAQNFHNAASSLGQIDLPPVLDIESNPAGLWPESLTAWCRWWCAATTELWRRQPIIYTFTGFLPQLHDDGASVVRLPLWIAHYTPQNDPGPVAPWMTWTMWQWTDKARIDASDHLYDESWLAGGEKALAGLCAWGKTE